MRCLFCNAEMVLMEAVQADPTTLPNFEHRTFLCPACHGVERRLVYAGARAPSATSHSASPTTNLNIGSGMPQSAWSRAVEKVLHKQIELSGRTAAKRRPDIPSTVEKLGSRRKCRGTASAFDEEVHRLGLGTQSHLGRSAPRSGQAALSARIPRPFVTTISSCVSHLTANCHRL
jgi:hypothetical protein